jgi:2-aminoadipate transaminase
LKRQTGKLIPVIFDKAYEDIIHNPEVVTPDSPLMYNTRGNVFEVGTFSKVLAPALRMGFMLSKDNEIRQQVIQRISDIGFSNSLINQEITSRLLDHYMDSHKVRVNDAYRHKAVNIKRILERELSQYTEEIRGGDAGFYFYITFKDTLTRPYSDFHKFLSRTTGNPEIDGIKEKKPRLIYIPGTICSHQDQATRQIRLSYGFENPEVFERAAGLIRTACEYGANK